MISEEDLRMQSSDDRLQQKLKFGSKNFELKISFEVNILKFKRF